MEFTGLETILIGIVASGAGGVAMKVLFGNKSVSCKDCQEHRGQFRSELDAFAREQESRADKDKKDHGMILRMLRSIVLNLNIPAEKKEDILNDR